MEMRHADYDLTVVGGGPAGCACAITAARSGARVLLLEAGQFPRHKVCGEFVSPESLHLLEAMLGDDSQALFASAPRITTARIFLDGAEVKAPVSPAAASITRFDLDVAMWRAAQASGAECHTQSSVESVQRVGENFGVHVADAQFTSRAVVNATGRWSRLPRRVLRERFEADNGPRWIGVKAHFEEQDPAQSCDLYFFEGGYCGVQPIGESRVNACAMVRADVASSLEQVFAQHTTLLERTRSWRTTMKQVTTSPLIFAPVVPVEDGVLFAGDSAGFVDPFTGDGISLALRSGTFAAEAMTTFIRGDSLSQCAATYAEWHERNLRPVYANAARLRGMLSAPRFLRAIALQAMRFPGVASWAVRATRGKV